jgi:UDP-N-acetylglucosamine 4,6-dehydratase
LEEGLNWLITGGTGTLGHYLTREILDKHKPNKIAILSRDEYKQAMMAQEFNDGRLRFFIGDVRDKSRLFRAFAGVDVIVHCAALKRIDQAEYNPWEVAQTNVLGTQNVIEAAIDREVGRVLFASTDKACQPLNTYGKTKALAESLVVQGNAYSSLDGTKLSCVRYGNVAGSRGSVIHVFREQVASGRLTITDERMTRFWITPAQAVKFVISALEQMVGGEIFVPRLPSVRIIDLAEAVAPGCEHEIVGLRAGEKLHETLITSEEALRTIDRGRTYIIKPYYQSFERSGLCGKRPSFEQYSSDSNSEWLSVGDIRRELGEK